MLSGGKTCCGTILSFYSPVQVDLLIVMGSSLKVRPVSLIPSMSSPHTSYSHTPYYMYNYGVFLPCTGVLDSSVPQVLINREPLPHMTFDIQLLGYSDTIVGELCRQLGAQWVELVGGASGESAVAFTSPEEHIHLFPGAVWKTEPVDSEPKYHTQNETNGHTHTLNSAPNAHPLPGTCDNTDLISPFSNDHTPKSSATLTSEPQEHTNSQPSHQSLPALLQTALLQPHPTFSTHDMMHKPPPDNCSPPTKRLRTN